MVLHRSRRLLAVGFVSLLALLGAGCGDDGDAVEAEADPGDENAEGADDGAAVFDRDACELLTDEQVAAVLGDGAEAESTPGDETISQPAACTWSTGEATVDITDPGATGITVFLGDRQIYDNTRIGAESGDDFAELDIGDEAYAGRGLGGVLVGDVGITVTPIGVDVNDPATQDLVVDLLEQVAANA